MKAKESLIRSHTTSRRSRGRRFVLFVALAFLALPSRAHASFLHGETLDSVADVIAWFAFIIVPPVLIGVFLLVHILPEKVAEKRRHPQLGAIKCLCLLSLCFGGLLWPIAWLWAYSKPVLHKLAYGTDVDESLGHHGEDEKKEESEVERLRARVVELETKLSPRGGKA
jgi:CBS domain containing-hemolysin-like protein